MARVNTSNCKHGLGFEWESNGKCIFTRISPLMATERCTNGNIMATGCSHLQDAIIRSTVRAATCYPFLCFAMLCFSLLRFALLWVLFLYSDFFLDSGLELYICRRGPALLVTAETASLDAIAVDPGHANAAEKQSWEITGALQLEFELSALREPKEYFIYLGFADTVQVLA